MALRSKVGWILPGLLWLWVFAHLRVEWTLNSQYNYGWAVPFLAALLFYLRWRRRPAPAVLEATRASGIAGWMLLILLFPVRIIEEANPDWRLLSWVLALSVTMFSLLLLFRAGGNAWLSHFAFPICFCLVAVPWPVLFENFVVQTLMRSVASVAVEIAAWCGVGAYQLGNVIQLRNGFVGVDEACSGVKTLQTGIMVALVLGELLRLSKRKRFSLLVLGCGWVFVCNVFRATALVFVAAKSGFEALSRWHDWIGAGALLCGLAGMFALAWLWKSEPQEDAQNESSSIPAPIFPGPGLALAWLVVVFVGTECWYRLHERILIERPVWQVSCPIGNETLTTLPVAESTKVILRYDEATTAAWEQPRGVRWWSFFAHWKPQRAALQLVRSHSPEICLPAIGRNFRGGRRPVTVDAGPLKLDFRSYEFEQNGQPLFVFVCIQEDKRAPSGPEDLAEWSIGGRLRAALHGKRNLGQRLLEVAVLGLNDFDQATTELAKTAAEIVRPEKPTG